ncbi:MAG TPA: hypothetical protein VGV68_07095 [Terriglobia bacterium]|nr:hypothetical protein [Terriglobia bacterium]
MTYDAAGNMTSNGTGTGSSSYTWGDQPFPPVAGRIYGKYDMYFTVFSHTNALGSEGTTTLSDGSWASSEIFDPWGQRVATLSAFLSLGIHSATVLSCVGL